MQGMREASRSEATAWPACLSKGVCHCSAGAWFGIYDQDLPGYWVKSNSSFVYWLLLSVADGQTWKRHVDHLREWNCSSHGSIDDSHDHRSDSPHSEENSDFLEIPLVTPQSPPSLQTSSSWSEPNSSCFDLKPDTDTIPVSDSVPATCVIHWGYAALLTDWRTDLLTIGCMFSNVDCMLSRECSIL